MSMLSMLIKDPSIDRMRLMKICMVHDLAEAIVGDITPHDKTVTKAMKHQMEEAALRKIASDLDDADLGAEVSAYTFIETHTRTHAHTYSLRL